MPTNVPTRARLFPRALAIAMAAGLAGAVLPVSPAWAQDRVAAGDARPAALAEWSRRVWSSASGPDAAGFRGTLDQLPTGPEDQTLAGHVRRSVSSFERTIQTRETGRAERTEELTKELDAAIAKAGSAADASGAALAWSDALKHAVEMTMIAPRKADVLEQERVKGLVRGADQAAREAEARGDWLIANELFVRLHGLFEDQGTYKADMERLARRLVLLRLYVPQRLWELRNARQIAAGEKPLPPYNPIADSYEEKLRAVDRNLVMQAIMRYGRHVDAPALGRLLVGGLEAVDTLLTTKDLTAVFPGLADQARLDTFRQFLEEARQKISSPESTSDMGTLDSLLLRLSELNAQTIRVPDQALLHEFGNGAMARLDEFSAIIWPDELSRFDRLTQGRFPGVGIRIEYNETFDVRVVTPLDGRPAQRAGIKTGDLIKKVDGRSIYGATLDQAVDMITGPVNTQVTLTIERPAPEDAPEPKPQAQSLDFTLTRAQIEVPSVQGWRRIGPAEDAWDWFIDPAARVGYVRLSAFSEKTDDELGRALSQMQDEGLNSLIIDLRYNPGGLLDQAVRVVGRFIGRGVVVSMAGPGGQLGDPQSASGRPTLSGVPVVVLINEGSASASEIVSGALQHYAAQGRVPVRLVGERTFGKGSVQNVYGLAAGAAKMKLTTQYYALPDGRIIHRRPQASAWGVQPDLRIDMLPQQVSDSITRRRNADMWWEPGAPAPKPANGKDPVGPVNPDTILTEGVDPQLHAALVLAQSQTLARDAAQAQRAP
jgi:carboxyl-terminal processing protease